MRYGNPSKKNKVVASLKGHSIEFPGRGTVAAEDIKPVKNVPEDRQTILKDGMVFIHVPHGLEHEVAQNGMIPEVEIEETEVPAGPVRPEDPQKLKTEVYAAFDKLVAAAERESFGGHGVPKGNAVEKVLGYALNNAEIKDFWTKYTVDKKDA